MDSTKLAFATLNCRGLRDYRARSTIFQQLKLESLDIVFLQETHVCDLKDAKKFEKNWGGKAFWSFGTAHSSGVGILLNKTLNYKIDSFDFDTKGRLLVLDIQIHNATYRLINLYAPNNHAERKAFIRGLARNMVTKRSVILGGDFNFVENLTLDKRGGSTELGNVGAKEMVSIRNDFHVSDVFRALRKTQKEYTWVNSTGSIRCRLDRFYVSDSLMPSVEDVSNVPVLSALTDHKLVKMSLVLRNTHKDIGPNFWKCNINTLNDPDFGQDFIHFFEVFFGQHQIMSSAVWELFKKGTKDLIKIHSHRLNVNMRSRYKVLQKELAKYVRLEALRPNTCVSQIKDCEIRIGHFFEELGEGSKIRAKIKYLDNSEKPSRHFFRQEAMRQEARCIRKLQTGENSFCTSQSEIEKQVWDFYHDLYAKEDIDQSLVDYFLDDLDGLTKDQAASCEGLITKAECRKALFRMKNDRSPGIDGLPAELYKRFWDTVGDKFVEMANFCYENNTLSPSQRIGVISLLCKDVKNPQTLKNWRPISLLCVDYKIISKCITNRVSKVMSKIVNMDQTASVPGRSILDNIHLIRSVVEYCNLKENHLIVLSLDQMKAFDRVSHEYMFQVLGKYGFGQMLIKWIRLLYTNIYSSVLVNGFLTDFISIQRSVRQGCSLSPLLYVLCIEPLATKIRKDRKIEGFQLPGSGEVVKISQYADDTTLILTSVASVQKSLLACELYGLASGARLNKGKCWLFTIGSWGDENDIYGIRRMRECCRLYGIWLGSGDFCTITWQKVLEKFQGSVDLNRNRDLKLRGKAVILNTLCLSKIWYVAGVLPIGNEVLRKIDNICFKFVWSKKVECLKRKSLYNDVTEGGLGLMNVKVKHQAFSVKHILSLIYGPYRKWHDLALYWLRLDLREYLDAKFQINRPYSMIRPEFYNSALKAFKVWAKVNPRFDPMKCSTKTIYRSIIEIDLGKPRIYGVNPLINYDEAFTNCSNKLLSGESRDITYRMIHRIVPVNSYLYRFKRIVKSPLCCFCKLREETIEHLFVSCSFVTPLWSQIRGLFGKIDNRVKINLEQIVYNLSGGRQVDNLLMICLAEARWAIWHCRNLFKFQEKNVNADYIALVFTNNIKLRIKADFRRMEGSKFGKLWCQNKVFCKVENENLVVI